MTGEDNVSIRVEGKSIDDNTVTNDVVVTIARTSKFKCNQMNTARVDKCSALEQSTEEDDCVRSTRRERDERESKSSWTVQWTSVTSERHSETLVSQCSLCSSELLECHLHLAHCHACNSVIKSIEFDAKEVTCSCASLHFARSLSTRRRRRRESSSFNIFNDCSLFLRYIVSKYVRATFPLDTQMRSPWSLQHSPVICNKKSTFSYSTTLALQLILLAIHMKLVIAKDFILREKSSADQEMLAFLIGFVLFVSILTIASIIRKCISSRPFKYNTSQGKLISSDTLGDCENALFTDASTVIYCPLESTKCRLDSRFMNTIASASLKDPCRVTTSFVYPQQWHLPLTSRVSNFHRFMSRVASFLFDLIPWDLVEDDDDDDDDSENCGKNCDSDDSEIDDDQQGTRNHMSPSSPLHGKDVLDSTEAFQMANKVSQSHECCNCIACKHCKSLAHDADDDEEKQQFTGELQSEELSAENIQLQSQRLTRSLGYALSSICSGKDEREVYTMDPLNDSIERMDGGESTSSSKAGKLVHLKHCELKIIRPSHFQQVSYL